MIIRSVDGNIIGDIVNGIFTKRVQGSAHMLNTPPAWAIDCAAFKSQVLPNAHTIRVEDTESDVIYEVSTKLFDDKKVYLDRGFGAQYFLILKHWCEVRKGQPSLL